MKFNRFVKKCFNGFLLYKVLVDDEFFIKFVN